MKRRSLLIGMPLISAMAAVGLANAGHHGGDHKKGGNGHRGRIDPVKKADKLSKTFLKRRKYLLYVIQLCRVILSF